MNNSDFDNRSFIIIGGTSGLGLSAALALKNQGAKVLVVGRSADTCKEAFDVLGEGSLALIGDATKESTIEEAIDLADKSFGRIDGLYHVAGGSGRRWGDGPLHELTLEGWNKTMELNLTSMMLSNRGIIKYFLKKKQPGTILNMGSVLGYSPSPKYFVTHAYAASKSAIIGYSKSIASYYAKDNIRINVIAPSLYSTPMAQRAMGDEVIQSFLKTKQPLDGGRSGYPEDIDTAVLMFLSPKSVFTTGQVLAVDGGWTVSEGQF